MRRMINRKHGKKIRKSRISSVIQPASDTISVVNYNDLHKYSVEDYTFWLDLWEFLGIISSIPPNPKQVCLPVIPVFFVVVKNMQIIMNGQLKEIPLWFPGARLNYAENLLYRKDDSVACTVSGESGVVTNYSFRELRGLVRKMAAALRVNGLKTGDRVAGSIFPYESVM